MLTSSPEAFDAYRSGFRPSSLQAEPYLIVSAEIFVAESSSEARALAVPEAWAMTRSRLTGSLPLLQPTTSLPAQRTGRQDRYVAQALATVIAGTEDQVVSEVSELLKRTGADEVMSTASTFDVAALYDSDARLARAVATL